MKDQKNKMKKIIGGSINKIYIHKTQDKKRWKTPTKKLEKEIYNETLFNNSKNLSQKYNITKPKLK